MAWLWVLLYVVLSIVVYFNWGIITQHKNYSFETVSEVVYGQDGNVLVADQGKESLLVVDGDGEIIARYDSGSNDDPFCYVTHMAQLPDGTVYVSDIILGEHGNLIDSERIRVLSGPSAKTLFEIDYSEYERENRPLQYGNILELQEYGGEVYFVLGEMEEASVYRLLPSGETEVVLQVPLEVRLNDASYDPATGKLALSLRNGELVLVDAQGVQNPIYDKGDRILKALVYRNGTLYFSDLNENGIYRLGSGETQPEHYYEAESIVFQLDVDAEGNLLGTDYEAWYSLDRNLEETYVAGAPVRYFGLVIFLRILFGLDLLALLVIMIQILRLFLPRIARSEQTFRVLFVLFTAVSVSFFVGYTLMGRITTDTMDNSIEKARIIGRMFQTQIDPDQLLAIEGSQDYGSDLFYQLKNPLDRVIDEMYANEEYYYYVVYRVRNNHNCLIADYEESETCWYSGSVYGEEPYKTVFETGEEVALTEDTAYGTYTFVMMPIYDDAGEIIAMLEVGQNLATLNRVKQELTRELVINVAISVIVLSMLILEATFLLNFIQKRESTPLGDLDPTDATPIRAILFLTNLADSMQDAFIALLCAQLYTGFLPLPDGVAVALPMSAQLLMMALASLTVSKLIEYFGTKGTMVIGLATQMAGCICCVLMGNYVGILIGKMLIGTGMGIVYVDCNTIAASGRTEEKVGTAFTAVSAGVISGLTIGGGLASLLLSIGGWKGIYIMGAALMFIGLPLALTSGNTVSVVGAEKEETAEAPAGSGLKAFLANRHVLPFFLLLLIPFMVSLSFRDYFFPFVASENGFDEVRIGQIFLLCGMGVLYIGPPLSDWVLKKFGAFRGLIISSVMIAGLMLGYILRPTLPIVILGVVLLSLAGSFALPCQYSYFEGLKETKDYGEGAAMGMYSVMESIGQTVGPLAYGALLGFGYRKGILVACVFVAACVFLFVTISGRNKTRKNIETSGGE